MEQVVYPNYGISYCTNYPLELLTNRLHGKNLIQFIVAVQPNSNPHLGTITTILSCFALASFCRQELNLPSVVKVELLTQSPDYSTKQEFDGKTYYRNLEDSPYINVFKTFINRCNKNFGIPYSIELYSDFIKSPFNRRNLLNILQKKELLPIILNDSFHLRLPCITCGFFDKSYTSVFNYLSDDELTVRYYCPEHGETTLVFNEENESFLEVNTQLRTILKGLYTYEQEIKTDILPIWVDGSDWSGVWSLRMFAETLQLLRVERLPLRLFTPTILDWSGAKLSKSLYLQDNNYINSLAEFLDLEQLLLKYGDSVIDILEKECYSWVTNSSKFFRNYSIEYFIQNVFK